MQTYWLRLKRMLLIAAFLASASGLVSGQGMSGMGKSPMEEAGGSPLGMVEMQRQMAHKVPRFPPVRGFGDGGDVFFIHSEASDPEIAEVLTLMMGSPVIVVPELARAPDAMLANVYVFQNGVSGMGPLGYQPDVFDALPGTEDYQPLRRVSFVTWKDGTEPRVLKSAAALKQAESDGKITIERTDAVVNMPMLVWPLGRR